MIAWSAVRALTFDCYGTLVDWECGILRDLRRGLAADLALPDEALLGLYAVAEPAAESGLFRPYRSVLRDVLARVAQAARTAVVDRDALVEGLATWPVFPDTAAALRRLGRRYRLCVVSNVDRDLFVETEQAIGIGFDEVVTADQVGAYKPSPAPLEEAMRRLQVEAAALVHVAQSLYHDIAPARRLGLGTVWVDRRRGRSGGATPAAPRDVEPDLRVDTLAQLASAAGCAESTR
jgi:2-haloacid dehalogenase